MAKREVRRTTLLDRGTLYVRIDVYTYGQWCSVLKIFNHHHICVLRRVEQLTVCTVGSSYEGHFRTASFVLVRRLSSLGGSIYTGTMGRKYFGAFIVIYTMYVLGLFIL